ncbi:hypothetical protein MYX84_01045 [Acidobacteria bacterium AH-259-O06]|nr:hypothetical protein [Acidobacteria bacterium AH-259-O06]
MTEEQIKAMVEEALQETPGKEAQVSLVIKRDSVWMILLRSKDEELAIKVDETPQSTPESMKQNIIQQIRRLF